MVVAWPLRGGRVDDRCNIENIRGCASSRTDHSSVRLPAAPLFDDDPAADGDAAW
jgi:hypothetical protein